MNDMAKNLILWVIIAVVLMSVFNNFGPPTPRPQSMPYSEFMAQVKAGQVERVRHCRDRSGALRRAADVAPAHPLHSGRLAANKISQFCCKTTRDTHCQFTNFGQHPGCLPEGAQVRLFFSLTPHAPAV